MPGPELLEDEIGRRLREAERNGELRSARGYGLPLQHDAAWQQTPDEYRMPFKILKDAGVVPAEVAMLQQRARLREELTAAREREAADRLKNDLLALELAISLRLESMRGAR